MEVHPRGSWEPGGLLGGRQPEEEPVVDGVPDFGARADAVVAGAFDDAQLGVPA